MTTLAFLIPTKDRPQTLARTLRSVCAAAARTGAAIIVCDQSRVPATLPAPTRMLHRPDIDGLPAARNALLLSTDAEVVCFLDDDIDLAGDFAERLVALAATEPAIIGWGPVVEVRSRGVRRLHRLAQLGALRDPRRLLPRRLDGRSSALFGCCFAVRRSAALAVGFDARLHGYALGEDLDFFLRLAGGQRAALRFARDLRAIHRRDGGDRHDALKRGVDKARLLIDLARRHGRANPATLVHLGLALIAAASGRGAEPGSLSGIWAGLRRPGRGRGRKTNPSP